ncbi:MAG: metallophosphoesterase [Phycisphaerae bacterium]
MFALFLTVIVLLMSGYFFWRFHVAFPQAGLGWHVAVAAVLVLLASGRFIFRAMESAGWEFASDLANWILVVWMVILFWFVCAGVLMNVWNGLVWLVQRIAEPAGRALIPPKVSFFACLAIIVVGLIWGWFEAANVSINRVVIEVEHLPPGRDSVVIAQISDLHIGSPRSEQRLLRSIKLLQEAQPDMLVSTGDLVDADFHQVNRMAERFQAINPPLGKYAIFGNHEFYTGPEQSRMFHEHAGFVLLRQESAVPAENLRLVGVDDETAERFSRNPLVNELAVLPNRKRAETVILLKHRPIVEPEAAELFDLQLSGHIHGGQIFPFEYITRMQFDYFTGVHQLAAGSTLFVSTGTGTWGPPLRVGAPPEVTLIELRRRTPTTQWGGK